MPIPSTPSIMPNVLGYAADTVQIPETTPTGQGIPSFRDLFPFITQVDPDAGGVMVERAWMNALFNLLGQHAFFQQSGCVYPWQATLDYVAGCHVLGSDDVEYIALQSSGPDISAGAKDPVQEANRAYWVSLESFVSGDFVPNSRRVIAGTGLSGGGSLEADRTFTIKYGTVAGTACQGNDARVTASEAFRLSMIGVPRYWRSTTLPAGHVWANGDLALFADWPELKKIYDAGGFSGMLLPYNANSTTIAANLGKWRPNASSPTGLYVPKLDGQFLRSWAQGKSEAGATNMAGLPDIEGSFGTVGHYEQSVVSGVFEKNGSSNTDGEFEAGGGRGTINMKASRSSAIYGGSATVMPPSVDMPIVFYLGLPA